MGTLHGRSQPLRPALHEELPGSWLPKGCCLLASLLRALSYVLPAKLRFAPAHSFAFRFLSKWPRRNLPRTPPLLLVLYSLYTDLS